MYFPYLRGRQFELIALRELLEGKRISEKVIPIIEPVKPSSTLLKTLETFVKNDREIAVMFRCTTKDRNYYDTQFFELCQKCMKEILESMNLDEEGEKKSK